MNVDVAERSPAETVIVAVPLATPVTSPPFETVATADELDVQVNGGEAIRLPRASRTVTFSNAVVPGLTELVAGVRAIDAGT